MQIFSGAMREDSGGLFAQLSSYRYKVFVETLGWQLQTQNGWELDQFDRPDTLYVVSKNSDGMVNGCARLLPTDRPYLLGEVFPQLMNGLPIPCSPDIWELSRFAAVDFNNRSTYAGGQFSSEVTANLLRHSIGCAAAQGAKKIITVSPVGIERLLRSLGYRSHRAGPPVVSEGHTIVGCWIDIEENRAQIPEEYGCFA